MKLREKLRTVRDHVVMHVGAALLGYRLKTLVEVTHAEAEAALPPPLSARPVCPAALLDLAMLLRVHWREDASILAPRAAVMVETAMNRVFPLHAPDTAACAYGEAPGADASAPAGDCPCDPHATIEAGRLNAELARIVSYEGRPAFANVLPATLDEARELYKLALIELSRAEQRETEARERAAA